MMQLNAPDGLADLAGPITQAEFQSRLAQHHPELSLSLLHTRLPDPGFIAYVISITDLPAQTWIYAPDEHDPSAFVRFACY